MRGDDLIFREATAADMPGISHVRLSVTENAMTRAQLDARGITEESIAASFLADSKGWVAIDAGGIVGFSIADRREQTIFALFVLPGFEERGVGSRLFDLALNWLWDNGANRLWLTTSAGTKASRFYERRGWVVTGDGIHGDVRYELRRSEKL